MNLTIAPEQMYTLMYVYPNQTKSSNLTVTNLGGRTDTILLNLSGDFVGTECGIGNEYNGTGWKVWIQQTSLKMGGNETMNVSFFVRGPKKSYPSNYIGVTINASSTQDPEKNDTIHFHSNLARYGRIFMKCPDHVHTAGYPGTNYSIQFGADSDIELEFNLTLVGPPGWEYYLDRYNVVVPPWDLDGVFITLTVIPPSDAMCDEIGVVTVIARDASRPSIKTQVVTFTVVNFCMWLSIDANVTQDFLDPGNSTSFKIVVSNYGNMAGRINISLSLNQSSPSWKVAIDKDSVAVAGGESVMVNLTLTAPADATAGSRLTVRIEAFDPNRTMSDSCMFTVVVNRIQNISITAQSETVEIGPGESAACDFSLINSGNGVEYVRPAFPEAPEGWTVSLLWDNGSPINSDCWRTMGPGIAAGFRARLTAPSACLRGDCAIAGELQFKDGPSITFTVNATVSQVFDICLSTAASEVTCAPGSKAHFDVLLQNRGNGQDSEAISLTGLPGGWQQPEFSVQGVRTGPAIGLEPFGQQIVSIDVPIASAADCRTLELTVTASSEGDISVSVNLTVIIRLPDLTISRVRYFPETIKTNSELTITVTVANAGDVMVENVSVRFWDGKKVLGNEKLARLQAGSDHTVTFLWTSHNSPTTLKFMVDPDSQIPEINENDNIYRDLVPCSAGNPADSQPCLFPSILAVASLLTVAIIFRRVRRI